MAIYTVQSPGDGEGALERSTVLRDGFSWPAFVVAQVWLLYHRLWLAFGIWAVLEVAYFVLIFPHVPIVVSVAVDGLAHLFIGFEGQRLRAQKAARTATRTDVIEARDQEEAEVVFFRRERPGEASA